MGRKRRKSRKVPAARPTIPQSILEMDPVAARRALQQLGLTNEVKRVRTDMMLVQRQLAAVIGRLEDLLRTPVRDELDDMDDDARR